MSIDPVSSSPSSSLLQSANTTAPSAKGVTPAAGGDAKAGVDSKTANTTGSNTVKTVANKVTLVHSNGTITVTTTYTDGTVSTTTRQNPNPTISQSPLAASGGQLATLLEAQQHTKPT